MANVVNEISRQYMNDVKKLFNKLGINKEFEFIILHQTLSYQNYLTCLEFISKRAKLQKLKIEQNTILDISLHHDNDNYRISLNNVETINKYMKMLFNWKNHVIFKVLGNKIVSKDAVDDLQFIKKIKDNVNMIDLTDYAIRVRLSEEIDDVSELKKILETVNHNKMMDINFRLKERVNLYLKTSKTGYVRLDLTKTNMSKTIKNIENVVPNYELEIECVDTKPDISDLELIFKETELILKVIQQSNFIVSKTKQNYVLDVYSQILSLNRQKMTHLDGRKPESLEIQYVTENLPNKYAVTDKADGERNFVIIVDSHAYLINTNLHVKDTGIESKKLEKYNGSIMDGENIFLAKENRHVMMIFDCMFVGKEDIRTEPSLMKRLSYADEIIKNCFVLEKQKGFTIKDYSGDYDIDKVYNFHSNQIKENMDVFLNDIQIEKKYTLIRRKYFIPVSGAKPWEIFRFSELIWNKYTDPQTRCPYLLDGLIYHPLLQIYTTKSAENKFIEYKWKPQKKNSVDFYITFEKDPKTGKVFNVYDNSNDNFVRNKPYRIVNLFVGKTENNIEEPFAFKEEEGLNNAYLFLENGEVRDLDGKILSDKTVVEFYYNDDARIEPKFRWVPIRTRYDKTESVQKYHKNHGNYVTVANKVWRSITNPILMSDMSELGKGDMIYDKKIDNIRNKISKELIVAANKEDAYHTVTSKLVDTWRNFHNYVKSLLIYTHCNPIYQNGRQLSIFDIACGTGGDIMKFYYANISFLVGIDISKADLVNSFNGAISRYNDHKKHKARFPKMDFIHADAGILLNSDDQYRALGGIAYTDKAMIDKYFPKNKPKTQFDRINCQFAVHYMLKNRETLDNFKQNIKDTLKPEGYIIMTCFDARQIIKAFGEKNRISTYFTDDKGNKKLLWEVVQKYDPKKLDLNKPISEGNAVDFHGAWMFQEGQYQTEYLVDEQFIRDELEDCECDLVDTGLFSDFYDQNKIFINEYAKYESNEKTRKFLLSVKAFYDTENTDLNKACMLNDSITRYYIFRRRDDVTQKRKTQERDNLKKKQIKQKGGKIDFNGYYFPEINTDDIMGSGEINSIHEVLQTHKFIPKNISLTEFCKTFKISSPIKKQARQTLENSIKKIQEIGSGINIENIIGNKNTVNLDGIDVYVVDDDKVFKPKTNHKAKIVLVKRDSGFRPLYELIDTKDEYNKKALFTENDDIIRQLETD